MAVDSPLSANSTYMRWYGPKVTAQIENKIRANVLEGAVFLQAHYRGMFDLPKTGRWYVTDSGGMYQASAPGEPPAIKEAKLYASMDYTIPKKFGDIIYSSVGTSVKYAKELEFGHMYAEPRPFMRVGLYESVDELISIMGKPVM